jgi:hypothetical protein
MSTALIEAEDIFRGTTPRVRLLNAGPATPSQESAWQRFERIPMPVRNDENWRFANVKDLDLSSYTVAAVVDDALRDDLIGRSRSRCVAVVWFLGMTGFTGGFSQMSWRKGFIWRPSAGGGAHSDLFRKHFMREEAFMGKFDNSTRS